MIVSRVPVANQVKARDKWHTQGPVASKRNFTTAFRAGKASNMVRGLATAATLIGSHSRPDLVACPRNAWHQRQ